MGDAKTWIDVADTTVKIGLGAIIGGLTSVWLARINNKHTNRTVNQHSRRKIIESVVELLDTFTQSVTVYWADRTNAAYRIENGHSLSDSQKNSLKQQEKKLFDDFVIVNTCKSKLLLIQAKDSVDKLIVYRDLVDNFYKTSSIDNLDCTEKDFVNMKKPMSTALLVFYESLNTEFEKEIKKD